MVVGGGGGGGLQTLFLDFPRSSSLSGDAMNVIDGGSAIFLKNLGWVSYCTGLKLGILGCGWVKGLVSVSN